MNKIRKKYEIGRRRDLENKKIKIEEKEGKHESNILKEKLGKESLKFIQIVDGVQKRRYGK